MDRKRVLLGVPRWAYAQPECESWRVDMAVRIRGQMSDPAYPYHFDFITVPNVLVHFAREQICKKAVELNYDYVCMVDDDMNGPDDMWDRLLAHDVDIVAPLSFTRQGKHLPVVYGMIHKFVEGMGFQPISTHFILNYPRNTLFECAATGFGAVCIKTDVLKRVPPPWFFTFKDDGTKGTGEDIWFCRLMAEKGGARIFCDSSIKMGHLGAPKWIGEEDFLKANPQVEELYRVSGEWSMEKSREGLLS